jgi:hypothetical protein
MFKAYFYLLCAVATIIFMFFSIQNSWAGDNRELLNEMKLLEESLDLNINKALNNTLSGMSAKSK